MSIATSTGNLNQILVDAAKYIVSCQRQDGAILWFNKGKLDPWDHTEAAMGLSISGNTNAAKNAFKWLWKNQNNDGSWQAKYFGENTCNPNEIDREKHKIETNFVAYPACGLWHYYLISKDIEFVIESFPYIEKAVDFVLSLQNKEGDIQWATSTVEIIPKDALITACSSILRSLECAIHLADLINIDKPVWREGYRSLAEALKNKPWRFDRSWAPKTRFSMDWFYPILTGIYTIEEAQIRLDQRWHTFVHPDFGCRCVSDEPWVTVAESCELSLALVASKRDVDARKIFTNLLQWQDTDGGFWTGYSFRDNCIWPQEKTTWTAAAILLAADALENITPAAKLFTQPSRIYQL